MAIDQAVNRILKEVNYRENAYFTNLKDGEFSKEDFVETQIQFYEAVIFFSRPMATLAAKIPTPDLRVEILRNVWEEHGEGDSSKGHGRTFITFLSRLDNITPQDIAERVLWPEVRIFNTTLVGACALDDYLIGVGLMGIIERMFCDISSLIAEAVLARKWLERDQMIHYSIHQELDIRHSQDFFDVLSPVWEKNPEDRYAIEQGLAMGATLFNDLYSGLYRGRKRRWKIS